MANECKIDFDSALGHSTSAEEFEKVQVMFKDFERVLQGLGYANAKDIIADLRASPADAKAKLRAILDEALANEARDLARAEQNRLASWTNAQRTLITMERNAKSKNLREQVGIGEGRTKGQKEAQAFDQMIRDHADGRFRTEMNMKQNEMTARADLERGLDEITGGQYHKLLNATATHDEIAAAYVDMTNGHGSNTKNPMVKRVAEYFQAIEEEQVITQMMLGSSAKSKNGAVQIRYSWPRVKKDPEAWINYIAERMDPVVHGELEARRNFARVYYERLKVTQGQPNYGQLTDIFWRSGKDWVDVNNQFGIGSFMDAFQAQHSYYARREAVHRQWTANPSAVFNRIKERYQDDPVALSRIEQSIDYFDRMINPPIPDRPGTTRTINMIRSVENFKLAASSMLTPLDIPALAAKAKIELGSGIGRTLSETTRSYTSGELKEFGRGLLSYVEGMMGSTHNRMSLGMTPTDRVQAGLSRANDLMMRYNGMEFLNGRNKDAAMGVFLDAIGANLKHDWSALSRENPRLFRLMDRYGVSEADWKAMQGTELHDGRYFDPSKLPQEATVGVRLRDKVQAAAVSFIEAAIPTPGVIDEGLLTLHTRPGSVQNALLKMFTQFGGTSVKQWRSVALRGLTAEHIGWGERIYRTAMLTAWTMTLAALVVQGRQMMSGNRPYAWDSQDLLLNAANYAPLGIIWSLYTDLYGDAMAEAIGAEHKGSNAVRDTLGAAIGDLSKLTVLPVLKALGGNPEKAVRMFTQTLLRQGPLSTLPYTKFLWRQYVMDSVHEFVAPNEYRKYKMRRLHDTKGRARSLLDQRRPTRNELF